MILPFVAWLFIRTLYATLRVRHVGVENIEKTPQYVIAFWHCHLLLMLHCRWHRPMTTLISRSKDGEIIARVFQYYDVVARRGSSSRGGGAAVREIIRDARSGMNVGFTPDGPRGPARVAKDGVVYVAKLAGLPIVPVAFAARNRKLLRSWDRMIVPLPFSKALFLYGEPIRVPRDGDVEEWRLRVERTLNDLADEAERLVRQP
jgi:lysophospholipid acyltransferase (LPLAT)-like uncharacterized protein